MFNDKDSGILRDKTMINKIFPRVDLQNGRKV